VEFVAMLLDITKYKVLCDKCADFRWD